MSDNPTLSRMVEAIEELSEDTVRRLIGAAFERMSDADLRGAYLATDGEPGDPIADMLAIVAEDRGLDL